MTPVEKKIKTSRKAAPVEELPVVKSEPLNDDPTEEVKIQSLQESVKRFQLL